MLELLAQTGGGGGGGGVVAGIVGLFIFALYIGVIVLIIAGFWKTFAKAGQPGWAALIPIYNIIVLLQVAGRPIWWIILFLIPVVSLIVAIIVALDVAKNFGKSVGFAIGLILLPFIFYPILGFGSAQYNPKV